MSDLYLVLRRRLEDVTDWVEIGTAPLHDARKALGLSYEAMGRKLNVAAKTWERWEKAGRVPRYELRRVAELLDLEIDWPTRASVIVAGAGAGEERIERLERELGEVRQSLAALGEVRESLARIEDLLLGNGAAAQSR
jgi:transcriptional regulator with XRE-family HTH domain